MSTIDLPLNDIFIIIHNHRHSSKQRTPTKSKAPSFPSLHCRNQKNGCLIVMHELARPYFVTLARSSLAEHAVGGHGNEGRGKFL